MRIVNIKEYKDVAETLSKLVAGTSGGSKDKKPSMLDALNPPPKKEAIEDQEEEDDAATILAEVVNSGKED